VCLALSLCLILINNTFTVVIFKTLMPSSMGFPGPTKRRAPKSVLEQRIDALTASIRSKPDWKDKINYEDIVAKWKAESESQGIHGADFAFAMKVGRRSGQTLPSRRMP
jgi:hypothetical protein